MAGKSVTVEKRIYYHYDPSDPHQRKYYYAKIAGGRFTVGQVKRG